MNDFVGNILKDGDKIVYFNENFNPSNLFSEALHKGVIMSHKSFENEALIESLTPTGYIDTVWSNHVIKCDW